jgi:hypothetical protein
MSVKLIRVRRDEPVYQFGGILISEPGPGQDWAARHYDYTTPDGRWLVQPTEHTCDGARWQIIDTTGEFVCTSCEHNPERHCERVSALDVARMVIEERQSGI